MKKVKRNFFLILCILFLAPAGVGAQSSQILINEFTPESPQRVEIINTSLTSVNLGGWYVDDDGGATYYTIPAGTILGGDSCIVITGSFNLNNSSTSDSIRLFDATAVPTATGVHLVDSHSYTGPISTGQSIARTPHAGSTWIQGPNSFGLHNDTRSTCIALTLTSTPTMTQTPSSSPTPISTPTPTNTPTPSLTLTPTSTPPIDYAISLNEVMVAPADDEPEWIELYNSSTASRNLVDWVIDDVEGGGATPETFSLQLPAHGYAAINLAKTMLNNDGDAVRLLDPSMREVERFIYDQSSPYLSWAKPEPGASVLCLQVPTKDTENAPCPATPTPPIPSSTPSPLPTKSPTPSRSQTPTPSLTPTLVQASTFDSFHVILTEVYPHPQEDEHEWVELYNQDDTTYTLQDWYIDDTAESGSAPRKISLVIAGRSYTTIEFTTALFNNSGDTVRLLDPSGAERSYTSYSSSVIGTSIGRSSDFSDHWCDQIPTRGETNAPCQAPTSTRTPTLKAPTPSPKLSVGRSITQQTSTPRADILGISTTHRPDVEIIQIAPTIYPTHELPEADTVSPPQLSDQYSQSSSLLLLFFGMIIGTQIIRIWHILVPSFA